MKKNNFDTAPNGKMKISELNSDGASDSVVDADDSEVDEDLDDELARIQKHVERLSKFKDEIILENDEYLKDDEIAEKSNDDLDIYKVSESRFKSEEKLSCDELIEQMRNEANIECEEVVVEHEESENSNNFPDYLRHTGDNMGIDEEVEIDHGDFSDSTENEIKKIHIKKKNFESNGDLALKEEDMDCEADGRGVKHKNLKKGNKLTIKVSDDEYLPEKGEGDARKYKKSRKLLPKRKTRKRKLDSDDDGPGDADLQKIDRVFHELVGDSDKEDEINDDDDYDEDEEEDDDDEVDDNLVDDKKKKRKRIKANSSSENDEEVGSDDDEDDENTASGKKKKVPTATLR